MTWPCYSCGENMGIETRIQLLWHVSSSHERILHTHREQKEHNAISLLLSRSLSRPTECRSDLTRVYDRSSRDVQGT